MNPLRYLEKRIRGWLPKEPHSSGYHRITNHKSPSIRLQIGIVAFIMGFSGALLGELDVTLGLGLFSGFGLYVFVILLIACITVAITIILSHNKKRSAKT
jgi:type III secretory pathway component EscV